MNIVPNMTTRRDTNIWTQVKYYKQALADKGKYIERSIYSTFSAMFNSFRIGHLNVVQQFIFIDVVITNVQCTKNQIANCFAQLWSRYTTHIYISTYYILHIHEFCNFQFKGKRWDVAIRLVDLYVAPNK